MNKKLLVISLVFAFVLASCGGGSGPSTTIDVTFAEFTFTPNAFSIPAGQEITLNITNNGAVTHEFIIMKLGEAVGEDFGDEDKAQIFWEVQAEPGEQKTVTFMAPAEPGEYQIVCGTPGHYTAGMIGALTVAAGE